jgi:putative DNA primase/helicase
LYGEHFEFDPHFKLWLSTNHKPNSRGTDDGIWRRIRLIPFTVRIADDKIDNSLPDKLKAESPGILAWAVNGLRNVTLGLNEPDCIRNAALNIGRMRMGSEDLCRHAVRWPIQPG